MFSLADSRESPTQTAEGLAANHLSFSLCERANRHMFLTFYDLSPTPKNTDPEPQPSPYPLLGVLSVLCLLCWIAQSLKADVAALKASLKKPGSGESNVCPSCQLNDSTLEYKPSGWEDDFMNCESACVCNHSLTNVVYRPPTSRQDIQNMIKVHANMLTNQVC